MTTLKLNSAAISAVALMALAGGAYAQAPVAARPAAQAAAAAGPTITHGPVISGLCVVDVDRIIGESAVGKVATARLQKLTTDVQAELTAEQTALANDAKTFDAQRATLAADAVEKRGSDLQIRANALQRKADLRQRELQATQAKAFDRIATELDPVEAAVYQQRNCSILVSRQAVAAANPAMDISPVVITALNARISTLTFERERLDQGPAVPQAR